MPRVLSSSGNLFINFAQLFFFGAALFRDILLIRICLFLAYLCLMLNIACGSAKNFGIYNEDGIIAYDLAIWTIVIVGFHIGAVYRMTTDLWKEIVFPNEIYESIWRCFYRRCGMQRLEFQTVINNSTIEEYKEGDLICDSDKHRKMAYLVIEGIVTCKQSPLIYPNRESFINRTSNSNPESLDISENSSNDIVTNIKFYSGELYDLYLFNVFGVRLDTGKYMLESHALTKVKVMAISLESIDTMAKRSGPGLPAAWRNMLLYQVSSSFVPRIKSLGKYYDSYGKREDTYFYEGAISRDFDEFSEIESNKIYKTYSYFGYIVLFWNFMKNNFAPFVPHGVRNANPISLSSSSVRDEVLKECLGANILELVGDDTEHGTVSKGRASFHNGKQYSLASHSNSDINSIIKSSNIEMIDNNRNNNIV
jgi:hypothetical protein